MSYDPIYTANYETVPGYNALIGFSWSAKDLFKDFEGEPKAIVTDKRAFAGNTAYLHQRSGAFLLPDSYWDGKPPLINVLLDTVDNIGNPQLDFMSQGHELRFRGEIDLVTDNDIPQLKTLPLFKRDFTEKNALGRMLAGNSATSNRGELDKAFHDGHSLTSGYRELHKKAKRRVQTGLNYISANVPQLSATRTIGGYLTLRNTYAFGIFTQIQDRNIMMLFEACEDGYSPLQSSLEAKADPGGNEWDPRNANPIFEFEFELKEIHGLPYNLTKQEKADLKVEVVRVMDQIHGELLESVPGMAEGNKSKSEMTMSAIAATLGFPDPAAMQLEILQQSFDTARQDPEIMTPAAFYSIQNGKPLKEALDGSAQFILSLANSIQQSRVNGASYSRLNGFSEIFRCEKPPQCTM